MEIKFIFFIRCPVDPYVFPELDKLRSGDTLEARFNAFKIPESNFLVFEATVKSCREGCQPVIYILNSIYHCYKYHNYYLPHTI